MKLKSFMLALVMATSMLTVTAPTKVFAEEVVEDAELTLGSVKIYVNGNRVRKQTLLYNDSTYLPLRALAEALGKEIDYDPVTVTAYINSTPAEYPPSEDNEDIDTVQNVTATLYIGRTKLMVDGKDVPQETLLYNDSAYAPLRAVAEMMNMDVSYDDSIKSAMLQDKGEQLPKAIVYYEDFPAVIDFGAYAELSEDRIRKSMEADETKFLYLNVTDGDVAGYITELENDGFIAEEQESENIYTYKKDNATVTIDNETFKSTNLMVVAVSQIPPFSYTDDFPEVPLFSPEMPSQTTATSDKRGIIYTYTGISDQKISEYIEELDKLGFSKNAALSAANRNVYNLDEISVAIDLNEAEIVNITIRDEIFLFQKEFPTVPTFSKIKPENTTPSEDGNGFVYWYKGTTDSIINDYIGELSKLGYVTDASVAKAGYYAYKRGDVSILIDTLTYMSTGYVLLTVSKAINVVYYPNYPTVPSFPARIETTSPTEDGTGTVYWHLNIDDTAIGDYAALLLKLGFAADSANTENGYLVYTKGDVSVTLDSVTRQTNGFFLLAIKIISPQSSHSPSFIAYRTYPSVPDIGSYEESYTLQFNLTREGESEETYWYYAFPNEVIQNYLKALIDNKFTNIAQQSSDGYWVYQKDNLILTVDTTTYPDQYTLIKVDTNNVVGYYENMSLVPDFATVVKKYWTMPVEQVTSTDNGYTYLIRQGNANSAEGYLGDVSLYGVYTEYLESDGFTKDASQPANAVLEGETRRDTVYVKSGFRILVTESVQTDASGDYSIKVSIARA